MKHSEQYNIPARTSTRVVKTTCDLCAAEIKDKGRGGVDEVVVTHKTGYAYPEGGAGETKRFDLCADCFENELVPWLASQRAYPAVEEWDY